MIGAKRGRKPGHVPGSRRSGRVIRFRASEAECQVIDAAAEASGLSVAEYLIQAALNVAAGLHLPPHDDDAGAGG